MSQDKSPQIVLIDDDQDDLEMLSDALQMHGFRVKIFDSGDHAVESLKTMAVTHDLPELIILDYNMPRLNGEQVLNLLKSEEPVKNVPVIIYSTTFSGVCQDALVAMGAHSALVKSSHLDEFNCQVIQFKEIALTFRRTIEPGKQPVGFKNFPKTPSQNKTRNSITFGIALAELCTKQFPSQTNELFLGGEERDY